MGADTKIQWCDATVNFWSGCTKVSAGCDFCYAEKMEKRPGRDTLAQCAAAGTAFYLKQLGARPYEGTAEPGAVSRRHIRLRDPKGGDPSEWPADLRIRQFPEIRP